MAPPHKRQDHEHSLPVAAKSPSPANLILRHTNFYMLPLPGRHLLLSFPLTLQNLWEAFERVQENAGCAGADAVTVQHFARRAAQLLPQLLDRVCQSKYRPFPLLEIVVQKKPSAPDTRRLLVPSIAPAARLIAPSPVSANATNSVSASSSTPTSPPISIKSNIVSFLAASPRVPSATASKPG